MSTEKYPTRIYPRGVPRGVFGYGTGSPAWDVKGRGRAIPSAYGCRWKGGKHQTHVHLNGIPYWMDTPEGWAPKREGPPG